MFHHTSNSAFGTTMNMNMNQIRTPGVTIHNDENAMHHRMSRSKSKKGGGLGGGKGGGLGLRPQNVNVNNNQNNISHSPIKGKGKGTVSKTPLSNTNQSSSNKSSSKRRALGDISNRKGSSNSGNGFGGTSKNASNGHGNGNGSRMEFSIYTPHKQQQALSKNTTTLKKNVNANANASVKKPNVKKQYPLSTKKKAVSFSLNTSAHDALKPVTTAPAPAPQASALRPSKLRHPSDEIKATLKPKASNSSRNKGLKQREQFEVEDIELSAGRTGTEERELLGEEELRIPLDVQQAIDDLHAIERMEREEREERELMLAKEYDEFVRKTKIIGNKPGIKFYDEEEEEVEDNIPYYFDHEDSLLYHKGFDNDGDGISGSKDDDDLSLRSALGYDVDDLICDIDDISI